MKILAILLLTTLITGCTTAINKECSVFVAPVIEGTTLVDIAQVLPLKAQVKVNSPKQFELKIGEYTFVSPLMYRDEYGNYIKQHKGYIYSVINKEHYNVKTPIEMYSTFNCQVTK